MPAPSGWHGVLRPGLRVALLALATWALRRELSGLDLTDLLGHLRSYGVTHLAIGLACTVGSFVALGLVELLALDYVKRNDSVPTRVGMTTAFVANAFSQSIGLALLTGAAVRLRSYARYHLGAPEVARVSAFVTLTATLGLLTTGAGAFLASTAPLRLGQLTLSVHPVGVVLALLVVAFLGWSRFGARETIGRGDWRIRRPAPSLATRQIALASIDWLLTGTILFFLLPPALGIGYGTVLRVYLVAQTVGAISHVPGGAGVFELLVLALLAPITSPAQRTAVVASLVAFRVLYYFLPLVGALAIAGATELLPARRVRELGSRGD
jgi:uncharacterized membrane protein YbhN (UPF0104 family)